MTTFDYADLIRWANDLDHSRRDALKRNGHLDAYEAPLYNTAFDGLDLMRGHLDGDEDNEPGEDWNMFMGTIENATPTTVGGTIERDFTGHVSPDLLQTAWSIITAAATVPGALDNAGSDTKEAAIYAVATAWDITIDSARAILAAGGLN